MAAASHADGGAPVAGGASKAAPSGARTITEIVSRTTVRRSLSCPMVTGARSAAVS